MIIKGTLGRLLKQITIMGLLEQNTLENTQGPQSPVAGTFQETSITVW